MAFVCSNKILANSYLPHIPDEEPFEDLKGLRTRATDFEKCKIIGRGAFGEVQVVRMVLFVTYSFPTMLNNYLVYLRQVKFLVTPISMNVATGGEDQK